MTHTATTLLGDVTINNVSMVSTINYCNYRILIDIEFEGNKKTLRVHSTDSHIFDDLQDLDSNEERFNYLMKKKKHTIEHAISDYIYSL